MAVNGSFAPNGPTVLVDNTARQIAPMNAVTNPGYRVRNLSASVQYFTHGATNAVTSVGAPAAGTPSNNTIGMLPGSVETFANLLPWMIASTATGFEVTPGEGV